MEQKKKIPKKVTMEFLNKLDNFNDERVSLSFVRRFFKLNEKEALSVVNILVRLHILESKYKLILNDKILSKEYNYLKEIPSEIFDDEIYENVKISFEKNVYLYFKVVKND